MSTKFKNLNIGFMEYLEDTPNLKDSPNYAAIIGSDNKRITDRGTGVGKLHFMFVDANNASSSVH